MRKTCRRSSSDSRRACFFKRVRLFSAFRRSLVQTLAFHLHAHLYSFHLGNSFAQGRRSSGRRCSRMTYLGLLGPRLVFGCRRRRTSGGPGRVDPVVGGVQSRSSRTTARSPSDICAALRERKARPPMWMQGRRGPPQSYSNLVTALRLFQTFPKREAHGTTNRAEGDVDLWCRSVPPEEWATYMGQRGVREISSVYGRGHRFLPVGRRSRTNGRRVSNPSCSGCAARTAPKD